MRAAYGYRRDGTPEAVLSGAVSGGGLAKASICPSPTRTRSTGALGGMEADPASR